MTGVEFRILGPVEVRSETGEVRIPAGQQRTVLSVLLLDAGRAVSADTLVRYLWGDDGGPAAGAGSTLRSYIRRLRSSLAAADGTREFIRHRPPGYLLAIDESEVDLLRFRELSHRARRADPGGAAALLDEALGLWRGAPLADVRSGTLQRDLVPALAEEHLLAVEQFGEALLDAGRHQEAARALAHHARRHPMRERMQGQLMRALARCGRQAEALEHYHRVRTHLGEELGISPGRDLEQTYLAILRDDAPEPEPGESGIVTVNRTAMTSPDSTVPERTDSPAAKAPAELPADVPSFTGRRIELDWLATELGGTGVLVLAGAAGVGKTALAVHAAHRVKDDYPDGQLFVDLRGHETEPLQPAEALRRFLRALGMPDDQIPADCDERAARFRSLLADRRLLLVLDNAGSARQVRPLLPGSPGSLALVTSRRRLDGLTAIDHARQLSLDVLSSDDAQAMLRDALGETRTRGQARAVGELVRLCDRLPLALRIAAARLLAHPGRPVDWLVRELSDRQRRLDRLAVADDETAAIPAAFDSAYEALDRSATRVFRLLGLHPDPRPSVQVIAALAGGTAASVQPDLDALAAAHLVQEPESGRYLMHDLLHLYARQRAEADEPEGERTAATARMLDYYLATADAAGLTHQAYYPPPERLVEHPPADPPPFGTPAEGLAWLTAEYPAVHAATRLASKLGDHTRTWQLADTLWFIHHRRRQYDDWIELHQLGLAAARELDDDTAKQRMLRHLGGAFAETQRYGEAQAAYDEALRLARTHGDPRSETMVLNNLGVLHSEMESPDGELEYFTRTIDLARENGFGAQQAMALGNLSHTFIRLGRLDEAIEHAEAAIRLYETLPESSPHAAALLLLGRAQLLGGRHAQALASYREGLERGETTGAVFTQAQCLEGIGLAQAALSGPEAARPHLERAAELFDALGHRRADDVRSELDRLARLRGLPVIDRGGGRY